MKLEIKTNRYFLGIHKAASKNDHRVMLRAAHIFTKGGRVHAEATDGKVAFMARTKNADETLPDSNIFIPCDSLATGLKFAAGFDMSLGVETSEARAKHRAELIEAAGKNDYKANAAATYSADIVSFSGANDTAFSAPCQSEGLTMHKFPDIPTAMISCAPADGTRFVVNVQNMKHALAVLDAMGVKDATFFPGTGDKAALWVEATDQGGTFKVAGIIMPVALTGREPAKASKAAWITPKPQPTAPGQPGAKQGEITCPD